MIKAILVWLVGASISGYSVHLAQDGATMSLALGTIIAGGVVMFAAMLSIARMES